jgi:hypothetical protein
MKRPDGKTNSAYLIHNGFGHCSLSQTSECTNYFIRHYVFNGELPADGTVCETDPSSFNLQNEILVNPGDTEMNSVKLEDMEISSESDSNSGIASDFESTGIIASDSDSSAGISMDVNSNGGNDDSNFLSYLDDMISSYSDPSVDVNLL